MLLNAQPILTIEAKNATLSGEYQIVDKEFASAERFAKLINSSPQGTLEFSVPNVQTAGTYKLQVYCFNGGITTDVLLSVN